MRLGRNFRNLLLHDRFTERMRKDLAAGALTAADAEAAVGAKAKADLSRQVEAARAAGYGLLEIDGEVPNPFLRLRPAAVAEARAAAAAAGVSLSFALPHDFAAGALAALQEDDRRLAVRHLKRYLDVAARLGCASAVVRPGVFPARRAVGRFLAAAAAALARSFAELGAYAAGKGVALMAGNGARRDGAFALPSDLYAVVAEANAAGAGLTFAFDVGRALSTVGRAGAPLPPVERWIEEAPEGLVTALHLGDVAPEKGHLHPPLHREAGLLKEADWRRVLRAARARGVGTLVLATEAADPSDLAKGIQIVEAETAYLRKALEESAREGAASAPSVVAPSI